MKVSVVIVTLNRRELLGHTLRSVFAQTRADVECVVVDGASADGTVGMLRGLSEKYGAKLRWVSEPDKGIYNAMNKGLAMAEGDVVGFLGAGDTFFDEHSLYNIVDTLERTGVRIVYGDLVFVREPGSSSVCRSWRGSQFVPGIFNTGWQPAHPTFFVRRECFSDYGNFDEELDISADFDLMFRFLERYREPSTYIPLTLVRMLNGGESNSSFKNIVLAHRNIHRSFRKYGYRVPFCYSLRRLFPKVLNLLEFSVRP